MFSWVGQSLDWMKERWDHDWADTGKTFTESWKSLPGSVEGVGNGLIGMATAPFKDDGDFWGSSRMWFDSMLASGGAVLGGTVGTMFSVPILNEASWLLDKAYRYGVARPISTQFLFASNSAREAYSQGATSLSDYINPLLSFNNYRKAWNDSEYVTPGQAIVYNTRLAGEMFGGVEEAFAWADKHDPRTPLGQAAFNSPQAEGWLKYTSGTLDFAGNLFADPGHGAAMASKAAKLRLVDKTADARYVMAGKVKGEVNTPAYVKVRDLARTLKAEGKTEEDFGQLVMPDNPMRGRMQALLFHAANVAEELPDGTKRYLDDVYTDTYLTTRAMDPAAFERLKTSAPAIYASFSDVFAKYTISDFDFQRGQLANPTGADVLRHTKFDAFVESMWAGDGMWGMALGVGVGSKMPRARLSSKLKTGYHSFVLAEAPIIVGALKRPLANLMTSQGWTPMFSANDATAIGLRSFKANLERSSTVGFKALSDQEVNTYVSWYGRATSDATRSVIAYRVEQLILGRMLKQHGISKADLGRVLEEANRWRQGTKRILNYERYYVSETAARAAERATISGRMQAAADMHAITDDAVRGIDEGLLPAAMALFPDVDGRLNLVVPDSDMAAINRMEPVMRSQFAEQITMMDYRALNSALRWHAWAHPKPKYLPDPTDLKKADYEALAKYGSELPVLPDGKLKQVPPAPWRTGLAQLAKTKGWYDGAITTLDAVSSLWKATTLFRPAQAPRNLASDVALTIAEFGKMPMFMLMAQGTPNVLRNFGKRGKLKFEQYKEFWTKNRANGTTHVKAQADVEVNVPGNLDNEVVGEIFSLNPQMAFASGKVALQDYLNTLEMIFEARESGTGYTGGSKLPNPRPAKPLSDEAKAEADALLKGKPIPLSPFGGVASRKRKPSDNAMLRATSFAPRVSARLYTESVLYAQFKAGDIEWDEYRNGIVRSALAQMKRDRFMKRDWSMNILKELVDKHLKRGMQPEWKDDPYTPGTIVVDPMTGLRPEVGMFDIRKNFDVSSEATLFTQERPETSRIKSGEQSPAYLQLMVPQLQNFVTLHADELLRPDTILSLRVKPDGNIAAGLARAKPETIARGETIKAGAQQRLKNFRYDEALTQGHTGIEFAVPGGKTFKLDGWAEGEIGREFQSRVSARDNPSTQFGLLTENMDMENMMEELGRQKPIRPVDSEYPMSIERAINAQIASDPVMRQSLEGRTAEQIEDWAWSSRDGRKWMSALGFRRVAVLDQIKQLEAIVNTFLPPAIAVGEAKAAAATALRQKALDKGVTFADWEKVFDDINTRPEVHGASIDYVGGRHPLFKAMLGTVNKVQRMINDMPVDAFARFPFMSMAYKQHGMNMAKIAGHYFRDADAIPADVVNTVKNSAREKAYHDTRYRLYDTAQRNDLAYATRFLMPFSSAMMDSYIKYGRKIRENPMLLVQGAYYWDVFERNDMTQDENGYVMRKDGPNEKWYAVNPTTGEYTEVSKDKVGQHRYIQFQLPTALAKAAGMKYYGVDAKPVVAINKDTLNVFLNMPSGGPLVAFPANEFALSHPEFGENKMVKKYLLPYGPSSNRTKVFLPSTVRSAWDAFIAEDGNTLSGHAASIMQAELIGYGLGTRNEPPTFEEVREKAQQLQYLRFMSTFGSPASFQLTSPYQPYIDSYRQLVAADPKTAAEEFMRIHGDEFYAVTMSVTRNNTGLSATLESSAAYDKYKDLISKYPDFGGLIVGSEGAGDFAKSVYEAQKDTPVGPGDPRTLREIMPLADSVSELNKKTVWAKYSQLNSLLTAALTQRGLKSLQDFGAKDLKAQRDAFITTNMMWDDPRSGERQLSPWYLDFNASDGAGMDRKIEAMWAIVKDPKLAHRDDIQGLAEYLVLRQQFQQTVMKSWGFKTLDSVQASGMRDRWDGIVHDRLIAGNPAFADLWSRYLSNDQLEITRASDMPPVAAQFGTTTLEPPWQ